VHSASLSLAQHVVPQSLGFVQHVAQQFGYSIPWHRSACCTAASVRPVSFNLVQLVAQQVPGLAQHVAQPFGCAQHPLVSLSMLHCSPLASLSMLHCCSGALSIPWSRSACCAAVLFALAWGRAPTVALLVAVSWPSSACCTAVSVRFASLSLAQHVAQQSLGLAQHVAQQLECV
jgi:hypothetical protein